MGIGTYDNSYNRNKVRIDTRPQSDPAVQAGMRNIRRDMSGNAVGGITAEGQRIGTARQSRSTSSGFRQSGNYMPNPPSNPNFVAPATGSTLQGRQSLFRTMTQAGANFLTPEMREEANRLGVTDQAFNASAGRLLANEQITPPRSKTSATAPAATPAPGVTPPATTPAAKPAVTPPATAAPAPAPSAAKIASDNAYAAEFDRRKASGEIGKNKETPFQPKPRINKLTGLPFGYRPGDKVDAPQQKAADKSVANMNTAQELEMQQPGKTTASARDRAGANRSMQEAGVMPRPESRFRRPGAPATRGPASQPAPKYQDPTEKGGAFSREAYAKTAAAQQEGYDKEAIRKGTASEATKKKWKTYADERARGVKMDAEIAKMRSGGSRFRKA